MPILEDDCICPEFCAFFGRCWKEKIPVTEIKSYPSIYNLGHKALGGLFSEPVIVEEKVDGSQFSMTRGLDGSYSLKSKNATLYIDNPTGMFSHAIGVAQMLPLIAGYIYRCEYLQKPKHNTLAYNTVPTNHLILFDVETGDQTFMSYAEKHAEACRLGIDCVPLLYTGIIDSPEMLMGLMDTESILGGTKIEGVVVKNYYRFTEHEKKVMMGKYVSEAFKEKHSTSWKIDNPSGKESIQILIDSLTTDARWEKAVQHLRDQGKLEGSPRDIGGLIREVPDDILKECEDEIKDALFKRFWPDIKRGVTRGLPEWYKNKLMENSFKEDV